jgi:hypothetical protein
MKQDDEVVGKRAQLEVVHSYISHLRVPSDLKAEIEAFFHARLQKASLSSIRDEHVYSGLPIALQIEVSTVINRSLVAGCGVLRGCSDGFLDRLSALLVEIRYEPETVIFRTNEACRELLLIQTGAVDTYEEPEQEGAEPDMIETLTAGESIGDVPFVFGIRHFKTVRAAQGSATTGFILKADLYKALLKAFPEQEDIVMDNAMRQYEGTPAHAALRSIARGLPRPGQSRGAPPAPSCPLITPCLPPPPRLPSPSPFHLPPYPRSSSILSPPAQAC